MDESMDIREIFLELWKRKFLIFAGTVCGFCLSAIYAFTIAQPVFESSVLLLPTQNQGGDQLGAAAALLGKKQNSNVDVELYQSLLTSRTVLHRVLSSKIRNLSDTGKGKVQPLFQILGVDTTNPIQLDNAVQSLINNVSVDPRETGEGGIIEVRVRASSAWLAQEFGNSIIEIGQEELRGVRIKKSDLILERLSRAVNQAEAEWENAARAYAQYMDRNRSILLAGQVFELNRISIEKSAKEQKYLLARKELEGLELDREKAAPPMMILDPANLPSRKSKPKRTLIVLLGTVAGGFLMSVAILGNKALFTEPEHKFYSEGHANS